MGSIVDLLGNESFHVGLVCGALAAGIAGWLRRGAGLAFAAAVVLALQNRDLLDGLPDGGLGWVPPALAVVVVGGGTLVADFGRRARGQALALLAVTMFGVWVTVPETQHVVVPMGAVLPIGALGLLRPTTRLGVVGAVLATAVVAWGVAVDGQARPGAVVGGFACLGVMAVEPLVRRRAKVVAGPNTVAVIHVVLVAWCSRVAGMSDSAFLALMLCVVGYLAAAFALTRIRT